MDTTTTSQKSCGPQLSDAEMPSRAWDIDRLGDYVRRLHEAILKSERTLAPYYWRLGHALSLARENFNRGQWGQFLTSLGIDKTRSSKARTIYDSFASADEVEEMSVGEAYEARRHKTQELEPGLADEQTVLPVKFGKVLAKVENVATQVFQNVANLTRPEKQELLKNLRQTISCLQDHIERLKAEIDADPGEAD